ncbi:MAG: tyrosine-type recombinase/integrase [Armatimonadetes bacterium]|nr:tyrosine-type recombinase/integrase [Armatimonadota bacterium]
MKFIRDCQLGKTLRKRQKKVIGKARCLKYIIILKKISARLNMPFDKVTQNDIEKFIEALENDIYCYESGSKINNTYRKRKYSYSTKLDYKKTLKKFYKWLLGKNEHYPELVDWVETYDIIKEIPAISRDEADLLADSVGIRDKAIIMFLFDSGARAEEMLNIKVRDLSYNDNICKVRIVHSKTKPRTIHLPICSKYISLWLKNYHHQPDDYLFPISYQSLRKMINRVSKKILNKNVSPHILRHSSATYYAHHLKHFQLCYRYGWAMSSAMPNRYLDREGMMEEETSTIIKSNDISQLEKQNQLFKEELTFIKENNNQLINQVNNLQDKLDLLFNGKNFLQLTSSFLQK